MKRLPSLRTGYLPVVIGWVLGWICGIITILIFTSDWSPVSLSPTPNPNWHWSPDKKYYVSEEDGIWRIVSAAVIDPVMGKCGEVRWRYQWGGFAGWTADSRYAIFSSSDQYGNSSTYAFDTKEWRYRGLAVPSKSIMGEPCVMDGGCKHGLVAIASVTDQVLLQDGSLFYLPEFTHTDILTTTGKDLIASARWSPDEDYLVFVAYCDNYNHARHIAEDYALLIAKGDGTLVEVITLIDSYPTSWKWSTTGLEVTIETQKQQYVLDIMTHQVQQMAIH